MENFDEIKTEIDIEETKIVIDEPTDDNIDSISECEERHEMKVEDVDPLALSMNENDSGNSLINNPKHNYFHVSQFSFQFPF